MCSRAVHTVTVRNGDKSHTCEGLLFGLDAGCWIVKKSDALKVCRLFGTELPRVGYDRMLDSTGYNYMTNESGTRFRVSLRWENYDHAPKGYFRSEK